MKPRRAGVSLVLLAWCGLAFAFAARAHVGNPFIVFEGRAGGFPVRVVVRQPDVVPGLAGIHVRVLSGRPDRVTILPMHTSTDRGGVPRADEARPVAGEPGLYSGELWFMARGAYGVEVSVEGAGGGSLLVPVNAVARERKPLPPQLGGILVVLGLVLIVGAAGIGAAAVRESTRPEERVQGRWGRGIIGAVLALGLSAGWIWFGSRWWGQVEAEHARRVVFHGSTLAAEVVSDGPAPRLKLMVDDPRWRQKDYALIPDHGALLHLFLVGVGPRPAFAHLHPRRESTLVFDTAVPPLPAGDYRLFADVTHESGLTQTLTNTIHWPGTAAAPPTGLGGDDSWSAGTGPGVGTGGAVEVGDGLALRFDAGAPVAGGESVLRATLLDGAGRPATLEPYLRMLGHAVVMKEDGSVFSHVHPAGNLSFAAARRFAGRSGGEESARAADVICGNLDALPAATAASLLSAGTVTFPFVFPSDGDYRVWVQVRSGGGIRTGSFRLLVLRQAGQGP